MQRNGIAFTVIVKGRAIDEYLHEDPKTHAARTYVEGRAGSAYEIELRNTTGQRVETVVSVDGLSVTDGKAAGAHSVGYLLEPYQMVRIPGWKVDAATAASFTFGGKKADAYAVQATGSAANLGVIGVLAYGEKPRPPTPVWGAFDPGLLGAAGLNAGPLGGALPQWSNSMGGQWAGASGAIETSAASIQTMAHNAASAAAAAPVANGLLRSAADPKVEQTLGTAFGKATGFRTTQVPFERGATLMMAEIYYDTAKGLRQRGVAIARKPKLAVLPQAFPALTVGCQPPAGWQRG